MDEIQRVLIKLGRKDLAQKYYKKVAQLGVLDIRELNSGFMKSPEAIAKVRQVMDGSSAVKLQNGSMYILSKMLRSDQLQTGQIVAAMYNSSNQGFELYEVLGFTGMDDKYGAGGVQYNSARDLFKAFGVTSTRMLDEKQEKIAKKKYGKDWYGHCSYLVVKDLNEGRSGAWFYIFRGKWARGSGAEPLRFRLMKHV